MEKVPSLEALTSEQKDQLILKLYSIIETLEKEVIELKNQLNKNSQNSHKPPSQDGFKRTNSQRVKSINPSGAQKGHKGRTLTISPTPDHIIEHPLNTCPFCQFNLTNERTIQWKKAQIYDIPELKMDVYEHRLEEKFCPHCHKFCMTNLPKDMSFGAHYGQRIKALTIYLRNYHLIPSKRVVEFIEDIFNHSLSEGSLYQAEKRCDKALETFDKLLKKALKQASLIHADETGLRVSKKNYWLHVLSTRFSSYFYIHKKRGRVAMDEINILPYFKGILVHDHFKAYFKYGFEHALCNAHHLRELQSVFEQTKHEWAVQMQSLLKTIKKAKENSQLTPLKIRDFEKTYDHILCSGYLEQKKGPFLLPCRPKEICLLDRLKNYKFQTLLFMHHENVPFDNNQAERDIRMMKVKMKISGCFRSLYSPSIFCRIRSYISTVKKNGMAVFQSLVDVFNGLSPAFLSSIQFS